MLHRRTLTVVGAMAAVCGCSIATTADHDVGSNGGSADGTNNSVVQLGPRPFFLVDDLDDGALKRKLQSCANQLFEKSDFSIGHRGACLQFPEHTRESYLAAARQGAGVVECDVTFTKDKELVCRHSQCDLHTTTNIVETELNEKCTQPFKRAVFDASGKLIEPASALCCTSDITLSEFKTLRGKMDASNPTATTPAGYLESAANWRTDLYSGPTSGTLLTHAESIELFKKLGVKMIPELKAPIVKMPFHGFSQADYAQKMIDEYRAAGVEPANVWLQSFQIDDVRYWIESEPEFGKQAVYLDGANDPDELPSSADLVGYETDGINYVAPPLWALVTTEGDNILPSRYAIDAKEAGLKILTWTLERSGILADGDGGWYYQTTNDLPLSREGDMLRVLDVLARDVGIDGIFSDWPATVTYYANCMNLGIKQHQSNDD